MEGEEHIVDTEQFGDHEITAKLLLNSSDADNLVVASIDDRAGYQKSSPIPNNPSFTQAQAQAQELIKDAKNQIRNEYVDEKLVQADSEGERFYKDKSAEERLKARRAEARAKNPARNRLAQKLDEQYSENGSAPDDWQPILGEVAEELQEEGKLDNVNIITDDIVDWVKMKTLTVRKNLQRQIETDYLRDAISELVGKDFEDIDLDSLDSLQNSSEYPGDSAEELVRKVEREKTEARRKLQQKFNQFYDENGRVPLDWQPIMEEIYEEMSDGRDLWFDDPIDLHFAVAEQKEMHTLGQTLNDLTGRDAEEVVSNFYDDSESLDFEVVEKDQTESVKKAYQPFEEWEGYQKHRRMANSILKTQLEKKGEIPEAWDLVLPKVKNQMESKKDVLCNLRAIENFTYELRREIEQKYSPGDSINDLEEEIGFFEDKSSGEEDNQ